MGRCWKCDTELRLDRNEWICDNCNKSIGYRCWKCGHDFDVRNPITKRIIKECSLCGFYYCPNCNSCAEDCQKIELFKMIKTILGGQTMLDGSLIVTKPKEKIIEIIYIFELLKKESKEQKVCPYFVYSSYARGKKGEQGRIKQLLSKMNGIGVKNINDAEMFREKFGKILSIKDGDTFTINQLREDGRYGQEERDACNLGICMGELKAELITNKNNQKTIIFTKVKNEKKCNYLRQDNYVTKRCSHCNRDYNNPKMDYYQPNIEFCPKCIYKKGKKKNVPIKLIIKSTNTFICNCPYNRFITIKGDDKEDGDEGE